MECHGIPWTLCYFDGISVEFYGIQVECHEIPWDTWHPGGMAWTLCYFHGISVEFYGIQVECHGIPCDTEDRIILTVEIHGIWYSDKIIEWKAVEIHGIWPTKWLPTKKFKIYFKYLGGIIFHGLEYLIRHKVVFCFIS